MIELLYFVAIVLCVVVGTQVFRVYELMLALQGKGQKDVHVTHTENRFNARMLLVFMIALFAFYAWLYMRYHKDILPPAASVHGEKIDALLSFNFLILNVTFVITIVLLFFFGFKYASKKGRKALYFTESHKLELIWTVVPAIVMTVIIIWGLSTWNLIMGKPPGNAILIELYARQFDWTARYAGVDGKLGKSNYRLIGGANFMGLDPADENVNDDIIVKGEFHLLVNKPVNFAFNSQDVLHSAYMPHFRAQMNCVPGMTTQFHYTPNKTTAEMRKLTGKPDFNFKLICNKICGVAHYNMQMDIVVDNEADYNKWISEQKNVKDKALFTDGNQKINTKASPSLIAEGSAGVIH